MTRAIFLDRDGVINKGEKGSYCNSPDQFELYPMVAEAITIFHSMKFKVIVVTNQAGVAKGHVTRTNYDLITQKMGDELKSRHSYVDGVYACFHNTYEKCDCRKPQPGLILQAVKDHGIDNILDSYMIGDNITDIQAGRRAGIRMENCRLVMTGLGIDFYQQVPADLVHDNLWKAMAAILNWENKKPRRGI